MQKNTQLPNESATPSMTLELVVDNTVPITGSPHPENDLSFVEAAPIVFTSIDDLIAEFEADSEDKARLKKGRQWVADKFYSEGGETVRTLRLKNGWSQAALAEKLGTSQSHIARIEKGTENLVRSTLRRLCDAFQIDMNTLDKALSHQEEIWDSKSCD